ncbi:MAG: hypothetical protein ACI4PP_08185, partial [Clostridia bacterium]
HKKYAPPKVSNFWGAYQKESLSFFADSPVSGRFFYRLWLRNDRLSESPCGCLFSVLYCKKREVMEWNWK